MLKHLTQLLSLGLLLFLLVGCVVVIDGELIRGATVITTEITPDRIYYICDARTTFMTYEFSPSPILASWTSYLQGVEDPQDQRHFLEDLRPTDDSRVVRLPNGRLRVTFEIPPGTAPLSLQPQFIFEGFTKLVIEARDSLGNTRTYASNDILVRDPCF